LNAATQNTATATYVVLLDTGGPHTTSARDTSSDACCTDKGQVRLVKANDATAWLTFDLTSRTTQTGYREFALTNTGSSSANPFANGDALLLLFERTGDQGATGPTGTTGATGSKIGRAACRERGA